MQSLKMVPIPTAVAENVRATMKAPTYGFPAQRERAAGRAPCRHCLKLIRPQIEELILFTHDAFYGQGVSPLPGPVYIHAEAGPVFVGHGHLPNDYVGQPLTFEAFGENRARLGEKGVEGTNGDDV